MDEMHDAGASHADAAQFPATSRVTVPDLSILSSATRAWVLVQPTLVG